jgi:hypothetical protein
MEGKLMKASDIILNNIKQIDGEGSGLDADLIRGIPADFTNSLDTNGYQKLPNGLIIQWGEETSGTSGSVDITFPLAFPNNCYSLVGVIVSDNTDYQYTFTIKTLTTSKATINKVHNDSGEATSHNVYWISIGN